MHNGFQQYGKEKVYGIETDFFQLNPGELLCIPLKAINYIVLSSD